MLIFLSLKKGKITLKPDGGLEKAFGPKSIKSIGDFLAKRPGWEFLTSSSVNHPQEYGFPRNFDVSEVMGKAVEYAYRKLAIPIEPGPVEKAVEAIESAAKCYHYPGQLPLLFVRSGKGGKDILSTFTGEELGLFLMGIKYSSNLVEIARR